MVGQAAEAEAEEAEEAEGFRCSIFPFRAELSRVGSSRVELGRVDDEGQADVVEHES